MKLRITNVSVPGVGELLSNAASKLDSVFNETIEKQSYGGNIEQFVVIFVSVDSDPLENERYCVANNRSGRYKDVLTGAFVRYISFSVSVDPALVPVCTGNELQALLLDRFFQELTEPMFALPVKFDRVKFLNDLQRSISEKGSA